MLYRFIVLKYSWCDKWICMSHSKWVYYLTNTVFCDLIGQYFFFYIFIVFLLSISISWVVLLSPCTSKSCINIFKFYYGLIDLTIDLKKQKQTEAQQKKKVKKFQWCSKSNWFLRLILIESIPYIKMKCISMDALTLQNLSNISDLLSQITSYFTLQSLKKHHFKQGHMEKCPSITSEGLAFICKGLWSKWMMCLHRKHHLELRK